ncbi:unnamed protein product, partial [Protopolystoma xenopodis]
MLVHFSPPLLSASQRVLILMSSLDFLALNLDQRLLRAIADLGWERPTEIQEVVIPLVFEKKSLLIHARTGSGKTAAFAIPLVEEILKSKQLQSEQFIYALILAPTKELCSQVNKTLQCLCKYTSKNISFVDISQHDNTEVLKPFLANSPDIIIGTPSRLLAHARSHHFAVDRLKFVVIDEADLMVTFGYQDEMKDLKTFLPHSLQVILLSATLHETTKALRNCLVSRGEWIKVELPEDSFLPSSSQLTQYII